MWIPRWLRPPAGSLPARHRRGVHDPDATTPSTFCFNSSFWTVLETVPACILPQLHCTLLAQTRILCCARCESHSQAKASAAIELVFGTAASLATLSHGLSAGARRNFSSSWATSSPSSTEHFNIHAYVVPEVALLLAHEGLH